MTCTKDSPQNAGQRQIISVLHSACVLRFGLIWYMPLNSSWANSQVSFVIHNLGLKTVAEDHIAQTLTESIASRSDSPHSLPIHS